MEGAFTGINQRSNQVVLQVSESGFNDQPGSVMDQVHKGYQQIHAFAMRHFLDMPKKLHATDRLATSYDKTYQATP